MKKNVAIVLTEDVDSIMENALPVRKGIMDHNVETAALTIAIAPNVNKTLDSAHMAAMMDG